MGEGVWGAHPGGRRGGGHSEVALLHREGLVHSGSARCTTCAAVGGVSGQAQAAVAAPEGAVVEVTAEEKPAVGRACPCLRTCPPARPAARRHLGTYQHSCQRT